MPVIPLEAQPTTAVILSEAKNLNESSPWRSS